MLFFGENLRKIFLIWRHKHSAKCKKLLIMWKNSNRFATKRKLKKNYGKIEFREKFYEIILLENFLTNFSFNLIFYFLFVLIKSVKT